MPKKPPNSPDFDAPHKLFAIHNHLERALIEVYYALAEYQTEDPAAPQDDVALLQPLEGDIQSAREALATAVKTAHNLLSLRRRLNS